MGRRMKVSETFTVRDGSVRISSQLSSARVVCRRASRPNTDVSEMRCVGEKAEEGYAGH